MSITTTSSVAPHDFNTFALQVSKQVPSSNLSSSSNTSSPTSTTNPVGMTQRNQQKTSPWLPLILGGLVIVGCLAIAFRKQIIQALQAQRERLIPKPTQNTTHRINWQDAQNMSGQDIKNPPAQPKHERHIPQPTQKTTHKTQNTTHKTQNTTHQINWQDIENPSNLQETLAHYNSICQQVMKAGNDGVSCHTMSTLNSLRLYNHLHPNKAPDEQRRINALLEGTPSEAKSRVYRYFREVLPYGWGQGLRENGQFSRSSRFASTLAPHFISRYVFDKARLTGSNKNMSGTLYQKEMASLLNHLSQGDIGVLHGQGWRGSHMVSLVGVHEGKTGDLENIVGLLSQQKFNVASHTELLERVKLLIYDQLSQSPTVEALSLSELLNSSKTFTYHLFNKDSSTYDYSLENIYNNPRTTFLSEDFQNHVREVGKRIFGV